MLSKQDLNTVNRFRILRLIWRENGISRSMIAKHLGIDKSTVTDIVARLIKKGIVVVLSEGSASPQGGRKPNYLGINKNFGLVGGIELQPDSYRFVIVSLQGEVVVSRADSVVVSEDNLEEVCLDLLHMIEQECSLLGKLLLGIAIGTTGIIDPFAGKIVYSIPFRVNKEFALVDKLSDRTNIPIFIENDANCCAWGELAFHKKSTLKNFLYVLVEFREGSKFGTSEGLSVGMGIVLGGKVYYGNDFSAGEFRSAFCTDTGTGQVSLTEKEIESITRSDGIFSKLIGELAKNIALLVNTLNLEQVYLGGVLKRYEDIVTPILKDEIYLNWPYKHELQVRCSIHYSSFGENGVAYGAVGMFLERLFGLPDVHERKSRFNRSRADLLTYVDNVGSNTLSYEG